ncbi:MAG: MBL fold metallo-hydrolase, partial [Acidobacteriaceae bacterium]
MADLKGASVTWLGHSTVLVTTPKGTNILIDPFIEQNPKFPKGYTFPEKIDLILVTHAHFDHISDVVPMAKKYGAPVVATFELA